MAVQEEVFRPLVPVTALVVDAADQDPGDVSVAVCVSGPHLDHCGRLVLAIGFLRVEVIVVPGSPWYLCPFTEFCHRAVHAGRVLSLAGHSGG